MKICFICKQEKEDSEFFSNPKSQCKSCNPIIVNDILVKDLEGEIWKEVTGYDVCYYVSNKGRIKSYKLINYKNYRPCRPYVKELLIKLNIQKYGYKYIGVTIGRVSKTIKVSRIVAKYFVDNPNSLSEVNHINRIITDDRPENLEWVNSRENACWKKIKKTSKYIGVSWCKNTNGWRASISYNKKSFYLGSYSTEEEASSVYISELKKLGFKNKYATLESQSLE